MSVGFFTLLKPGRRGRLAALLCSTEENSSLFLFMKLFLL